MKNDFVKFVFAVLALVIGGALEELLPTWSGVGVPVLLSAVAAFALLGSAVEGVLMALAAGAFEESLASLPPVAAISFFVMLAVAVRCSRMPWFWMAAAYPLYQLWIGLMCPGSGGGVFGRFFIAIPVGIVTVFAGLAALTFLRGKAGADA